PGPAEANTPAAVPPSAPAARVPAAGKGAPSSTPAASNTANDATVQPPASSANPNITVRDVLLPKNQIDSKKKELDAKSPQSKAKAGGLAGRLGAAVGNT